MAEVSVTKNPSPDQLARLGTASWPIWEHPAASFPWHYDERETCHILEGEVTVTTADGDQVQFGAGDLVVFPEGLSCTWTIHKAVRKH
jgi:uncharacterized cupin superfamily protein